MIVRPYEHNDELLIRDRREVAPIIDTSWAWTVEDYDGYVLAVIGCTEIYQKTGHLWAHVCDSVRGKGFSFTKKVKTMLDLTIAEKGYKRVQAYASSEVKENGRWLNALGLEKESTMVAAFNGYDVDVYARIL